MNPFPFKTRLLQSTLEEFKEALPHFSMLEMGESFLLLQSKPQKDSQNKQESLFQFIDHPSMLETFGSHLSVESFLAFLNFLHHHLSYLNRLPFVLIGLSPAIFYQSLTHLQENHIQLLKHESLSEPLQYHLTQLIHEGESLLQQTAQAIQQLEKEFLLIKPERLTTDSLNTLFYQIELLEEPIIHYQECIQKALSIAWHTNRLDLIEKFSSINEALYHQRTQAIGYPASDHLPSTGLFFALEQALSRIFDATLEDTDAALEGLTRLSIWHLKDYWELGLLPSIPDIEQLNVDSAQGEEQIAQQERLFALIQQQLDHLQISHVGALKRKHLFSKALLKTYIQKNQQFLTQE